MQFGQSRLLFIIGLLLRIGHRLPPGSKDLGYVGVVHVRTCFQDLPALVLGPNHERVHWSFDVWLAGLVATWLADQLRFLRILRW